MKQIVILGAGYAGLKALKVLQKHGKDTDIKITLVDQNSYHCEATCLNEVAAGLRSKEKITYPIKDVVHPKMTTFIQDRVESIDASKNEVVLENNEPLHYDYLIVSLGFRSESFGIPGVEENSLEMVTADTANNIHDHILDMMKKYKETKDEKYLKIVVCGAGFTGIELLGSLRDAKHKLAKVAEVKPDDIKLYCVEAAPTILPMFTDELTDYCLSHLKKWDIQLMTGKPIKEIKPDTVIYQDGKEETDLAQLEAATIIWTTGVSGSEVIANSGFQQRRGRVMVNSDLTDPDYPNIYIIGDVSAVMDAESKRPYPTTAQIALAMGEHAAHNLLHQIASKTEFVYESQGTVASLGESHAFGVVGKKSVTGYPASVAKKAIADKSLDETGGLKEVLKKGRFDFYH